MLFSPHATSGKTELQFKQMFSELKESPPPSFQPVLTWVLPLGHPGASGWEYLQTLLCSEVSTYRRKWSYFKDLRRELKRPGNSSTKQILYRGSFPSALSLNLLWLLFRSKHSTDSRIDWRKSFIVSVNVFRMKANNIPINQLFFFILHQLCEWSLRWLQNKMRVFIQVLTGQTVSPDNRQKECISSLFSLVERSVRKHVELGNVGNLLGKLK